MCLNGLQSWWATERLRSAPAYFTPYSVAVSGPFGLAFILVPPLLLITAWVVARYYGRT